MKSQVSDPHGLKSFALQDDMLILDRIYPLDQFTYLDVSNHDTINKIIEHWALLKELSDMSSKR